MKKPEYSISKKNDAVAETRSRWLAASENASHLATELFQPGSGYGDQDARRADEHRLQTAKDEAERLFREYYDIDKRYIVSVRKFLSAIITVVYV